MNIKHFGVIVLFIMSLNSSVQGANFMAVKGLALDVTTTFASTDLHFNERNNDSVNDTVLNISCTDQNRWVTNYGQKYTVSLTQSNGSKQNSRVKRPRHSLRNWSRIHPLSF